ncbi:hypothetical protein FYJ24_09465 [Actinomycetaceae bacterium WB03_NA08]|uniref:Uncharacterized protein n=1 Tax=Scrofimicrobium canadense TaxID=2652290 RepID=A0A6N7VT77_9ACTO|nr:hypothetical protein [Scrofimicrobium canadense]MSS84987.1 hypothetical protein [Scrofimicrobium canadense]
MTTTNRERMIEAIRSVELNETRDITGPITIGYSEAEAIVTAIHNLLDEPEDKRPHVDFDLAAEIDDVHIETTVSVRYPRNHGADAARIIFEAFQNDQTFVQLLMMLAERGDASAVGLLLTAGNDAGEDGDDR